MRPAATPATIDPASVTTFGPALRLAVVALRDRAKRYASAFCPIDAEVAAGAAAELETLIRILGLHHDLDVGPKVDARPTVRRAPSSPATRPQADLDEWDDEGFAPASTGGTSPTTVDRARLEAALPASVRGALWDLCQAWDVPGFDAWPTHPVVGEFLHFTAVLNERRRIERGLKLSPTPALREACARLGMSYWRMQSKLRFRRTRTKNETENGEMSD